MIKSSAVSLEKNITREKIQDREGRHKAYKNARRNTIGIKDTIGLEHSLKHLIQKKELVGNIWIIFADGTELRNTSEQQALMDLATIHNYHVVWSTATTITSDLSKATIVDTPYEVAVKVTSNAKYEPTGTIVVSDGKDNCTFDLAEGSYDLISTTIGEKEITAEYSGDDHHSPSSAKPVKHTVIKKVVITP